MAFLDNVLMSLARQDQKILLEQVKILYRTLLPILAINLIVGAGMLYGLWNVVPQKTLTIWMALLLLLLVIRVATYVSYRRHFRPEHARRHGFYFILGSTAAGLLWGGGSMVLYPQQDLQYQLFILIVLVGMGAGSLSSLTTYLPAFFSYFLISLLPISIMLTLGSDSIHLSLGIMMMAYVAALSYFGLNINRALIQSLKLRFENIELVEQLRQQKDEAEQANMAKTKFLAAASHDLRQPLHALSLFTSVLDESIQYPKVRRVVEQIKASVQALQSLFNALLDISRLEAGVMKVAKCDFPLQTVFDKLANDFNPQAEEKGLRIIWPTCVNSAYTDPTLLEQILRNYITNAIRYTDSGEVRIDCDSNGRQLNIQVKDTGVGIPEEERRSIFDEFHQLNNPERDRSKGLGLGLAIVQRTANLLGHEIGVESQPGKGSTFSVSVELGKNTKPADSPIQQDDGYVMSEGTALMVVIDDEVSVCEGTKSLLELWGCEVITAADKDEAIVRLQQQDRSPDGIIADYRLRENQTGVDAIHAIHTAFNTNIPALIVTGDISSDDLRDVNNSGFQVLHKPVAPAKLRAFVRNVQCRKQKA